MQGDSAGSSPRLCLEIFFITSYAFFAKVIKAKNHSVGPRASKLSRSSCPRDWVMGEIMPLCGFDLQSMPVYTQV